MARWLSLSLAAVLLLAAASYAADVTVSGYVQYQYTARQTNEDTPISTNFGLKAARLKGACKVTDKISTYALIDGAKSLSVLEAVVDYAHAPFLTLRAGQFQVPFGYETQNANFDVEVTERSQIVSALWCNGSTSGYLRDQGVMAMGQHKLFNYKVACVNGTGLNVADNNNHKDIVARLGAGIPMFAGLGFSVLQGTWPNGAESVDRTAFGFDMFLDTGKLLFQTEYITAEGAAESATTAWDGKFGGYYVTLGYRVTPLVEPVFKYDKYDPDKDTDDDELTNMYFGVNLNFEGKARLQTIYKMADEEEDVDNNVLIIQAQAKF